MSNPTNLQQKVTLTLHNGASVATLAFIRYGDGTLEFTNANGVLKRYYSNSLGMKELFDALSVLV